MTLIIWYAIPIMQSHANTLAINPTFIKSITSSHGVPVGSSKEMAFMFGKEETGRPMAPEHIRANNECVKRSTRFFKKNYAGYIPIAITNIRG